MRGPDLLLEMLECRRWSAPRRHVEGRLNRDASRDPAVEAISPEAVDDLPDGLLREEHGVSAAVPPPHAAPAGSD